MSHTKKLVIIDDEIDLTLLLKEYFVRKKYDVTVSHSVHDGSMEIDRLLPDVVVLDNNLPDGTGWDLAPGLAARYPDMYIILVSAFNPVLPQMPAGAKYQVIEKPISIAALDKQFAGL